jgi:hypothetical protein
VIFVDAFVYGFGASDSVSVSFHQVCVSEFEGSRSVFLARLV